MVPLSLFGFYFLVLDIALYAFQPADCNKVSSNELFNVIVWSLSRLIEQILWIVPILLLFWVKPVGFKNNLNSYGKKVL